MEKSIKAILEEKEEKVPRIHDIITLREKIEKYIKLDIDSDIFDQLNELYIDSRYPADLGLLPDGKPSKKTADIFFKTSTKILNDIKNYLTEN
ncbi:MAG: HEPN domain-containing protein [Deltaproteobacteria bacterium]|nr:HEPN domain-containing protein [Deltaproteobacteria bacterium]